jgi:hypothetical protein
MTEADRIELLRDLLGETTPEGRARLLSRLATEPELARARLELAVRWRELELPPPAPAPPGFARRVRARAEQDEKAGLFTGGFVPATLAAGVLAAGVALGAWLGADLVGGEERPPSVAAVVEPVAAPRVVLPEAAPDEGRGDLEPVAESRAEPESVAALDPEPLDDSELDFAADTFADAYLALFAEEEVAQ